MPRIFDNLSEPDSLSLLTALNETLEVSYRADFCVGYFNLRGWKAIADYIDEWDGTENNRCRVLVGMQQRPDEEFRAAMSQSPNGRIDNATVLRLKQQLAQEFRDQLTIGVPTNADEVALQQLAAQLRAGKVVVKLFLRHKLHAKLYLLFRNDKINPIVGYMGSSNLTMAGLAGNGELNIDVLDDDATRKLQKWFEDRWEDRWCVDISEELADIIEASWARTDLIPPYHIYVKMAYHLSQEARTGMSEFRIPRMFEDKLFDYQKAAVQIAAHHLNKRGGVLIGDVVGLGKTFMATALARVFEDDYGLETLVICPKNLVNMWEEDYVYRYGLRGRVLSVTQVMNELSELRRYRLVIIDESHNLRNREGKRYRAIQDYLYQNDSMVILLSATPYNKTYLDLSNQLRLFIPEDRDLGIRPEQFFKEIGETEFIRRHQAGVRTLAAFEKSEHADDWRELMRLFMIRRTRSFIQHNYAAFDADRGRSYITYADGTRSYFPARVPRTVRFHIRDDAHQDQYAQLYATPVVNTISDLFLPRYGLGQYLTPTAEQQATQTQRDIIDGLSRAGSRLIGFCRTNLFKRLESSGKVFLQSLDRHILRNYIYLHALANGLDIPIGTQDAAFLDTRRTDIDIDAPDVTLSLFEQDSDDAEAIPDVEEMMNDFSEAAFERRAAEVYQQYNTTYRRRFKWLPATYFHKALAKHLREDALALLQIIEDCGEWRSAEDIKLRELITLLTEQHPHEKVMIFTQFADTVRYLTDALKAEGIDQLEGVTGATDDPTILAHRFSPRSNNKTITPDDELRVLIATDVLSEGQNLQDCAIVVNYDLPWAIIRLIQRAGRVDRIGQQSDTILCYTFIPTEGVERIIQLRARVRQRLEENAEVVGTDEAFFEEDADSQTIINLYNEEAGILDDADDDEVDLASYAYQIWQNAINRDAKLERLIPQMPPVSYSARHHIPNPEQPEGVLVYMRTNQGNDVLAWVDADGNSITESQFQILNAARCSPTEPALQRAEYHHEAVQAGVQHVIELQKETPGGQLGRPSGARFRTYERLKDFAARIKDSLFELEYRSKGLDKAIDEIYSYPLRPVATDTLNRQLKAGISDEQLADLVCNLREEDRLCIISEQRATSHEPHLICSLGLRTE